MAGLLAGQPCGCLVKTFNPCSLSAHSRVVPFTTGRVGHWSIRRHKLARAASIEEPFDAQGSGAVEQDFKPFERVREGDPYKRLGVGKDASFEEVQDARNFLYQQYKWHEPSRESIELAFDTIIQEKLKVRHKFGFRPPRGGRRGDIDGAPRKTLWRRFQELFDPTVTTRTFIREGIFYLLFAVWALGGADVSFPLACTFAYSVYKFQDKRVKANPEGPFLFNNPIVGALLTTLVNLAVGSLVAAAITTPLRALLDVKLQQTTACITVFVMGVFGVWVK